MFLVVSSNSLGLHILLPVVFGDRDGLHELVQLPLPGPDVVLEGVRAGGGPHGHHEQHGVEEEAERPQQGHQHHLPPRQPEQEAALGVLIRLVVLGN